MIVPLVVTLASVAGGAALAAITSRDNVALGALRTFAVAAVVGVVLVQILPEAVETLGASALVAFAAALVLPGLVRKILMRLRRDVAVETLGADLGYLGFLLHQLAEGVAIGTLTGASHADHEHGDLVLGMAAHTVPLTAVFVAAWLASRGRGSALRRTGGLLLASAVGFALAGSVQGGDLAQIQPWLGAFVAGFLCHVLLHVEPPRGSRSALPGALDVLGATAGVLLPVLTVGHSHAAAHGGELVRTRVGDALLGLLLETGPMLLVGLVLGALLQVVGARMPRRDFPGGGPSRQALAGIAIGAPLPLCACGVLPIAESMRRRGVGPAMVMAFLVAIPQLGPETLALTAWFLGGPFAMVRLVAALLVAYVAGLAFARWARLRSRTAPAPVHDVLADAGESIIRGRPSRTPPVWRKIFDDFDELLLHIAPWTFVGLVTAAYVEAAIPAGSLAWLAESGADVLVIGLVAVPTYVCAASATPLAAVLLMKGISPGAVLAGLLLGPATNIATIGALRRGYGRRAIALGVVTVMVSAFAIGWLVNVVGITTPTPLGLGGTHGPAAWAAVAVLGIALLAQLWRCGLRPWFVVLDMGGHAHEHGPGHDHAHHPGHHHDHDHGHDHGHPEH